MLMRIWGAIVVASLAWGFNGVATRAALNTGIPPVTIVAIRAVIASGLLYLMLRLRGFHFPAQRARWSKAMVQGVFQLSLPFILFNFAYDNASAGFVGLFPALIPLGTAIAAHFLLPDEPLNAVKLAGLSLAFIGVGLLLLSGDSGLASGGNPVVAAVSALGAVLSVSFAGAYAKLNAGTFDPMELTFMQFFIGMFLMGGVMLVIEGLPGSITTWGWMLLIWMSVVGSIVPFLLFFWLLEHVTATKASLVGYIVPIIALVAGIVLLDERLQAGIAIGGALILIGVVVTDRTERRKIPAAPAS